MDVKDHKALQTFCANSGAWTYLVLMELSCNLSLSLRMVVNNHKVHDYGWQGWVEWVMAIVAPVLSPSHMYSPKNSIKGLLYSLFTHEEVTYPYSPSRMHTPFTLRT